MKDGSAWANYGGEAGSTGAALGNAAAHSAIVGRWRAFFCLRPWRLTTRKPSA